MKTPNTGHEKPTLLRIALVTFMGLILVAIIVLAIVKIFSKTKTNNATNTAPRTAQVLITSKGFVPASLTVTPNTIVEWQSNDATTTHIVAANPYPTHSSLPGLVSPQLGNGAHYQYTFATVGTFNYHDDLNPTTNGTIIVK